MRRFTHTIPSTGSVRQPLPQGYRLSGDRWTKLRRLYMREHPFCERCKAFAEEVHHRIPRAQRPDLCYQWENLEALCRECHYRHHNPQVSDK